MKTISSLLKIASAQNTVFLSLILIIVGTSFLLRETFKTSLIIDDSDRVIYIYLEKESSGFFEGNEKELALERFLEFTKSTNVVLDQKIEFIFEMLVYILVLLIIKFILIVGLFRTKPKTTKGFRLN
ncbi:MAG: hypothetical protein H7A01_02360 [Hahellaceae bacterium]|nr:hypothetical protein [Hahellaceae bacterium]MCP5212514.1 hypothetical protein [Hahellaceae bacterium]